MKKNFLLIILLFFLISIFVLTEIVFSKQLVGRSLDFTIPPVSFLMDNAFFMDSYQWWGVVNGGARNTFSAALIPINSILYIPAFFDSSLWLIARYQLILPLFLGMLFFYILAERLLLDYKLDEKNKTLISIIAALFFTLNNYFFCELIFGSNVMYLTFAFVPLLIYSLVSYFKTEKNKFFFISLFSLVIISSTLQHLILAYAIILAFSFIYERKITFVKLGLLHFLLSQYWALPLLFTSAEIGSSELAVDYTASLNNNTAEFLSALVNKEYFGNRNLYNLALSNSKLSILWLLNSFLVLSVSFLALFKVKFFEKSHRKIILFASLFFIGSVLFLKGGREPFGEIVVQLYQNIPLFNVFRSLQRYLSFYVIGISILFVFSSIFLVSKSKKFLPLLFISVMINAMPWWYTLDVGTKNISKSKMPSFLGLYSLTQGNWNLYDLNSKRLDFSILPIPPGFSIIFKAVGQNKYETQGGDMGLAYGNKGFYAAEIGSPLLGNEINRLEKEMYTNNDFFDDNKNLFDLLNIKYFVLREDTAPLFSKNSPAFDLENVKKAIKNAKIIKSSEKTDYVTILENKNFLPHFYTPKNNIVSLGDLKNMPSIVSRYDYQIRSAIFFKKQNEGKEEILKQVQDDNREVQEDNAKTDDNQVLEFKKINPTKYRVKIHSASGQVPLVFSESFHEGWKSYLVKPNNFQLSNPKSQIPNNDQNSNTKIQNIDEQLADYKIIDGNEEDPNQKSGIFEGVNQALAKYKILDGNEDDQASYEELREYIEKGWVTTLGDFEEREIKHKKWEDNKEKLDYIEKYNIDFVSKNFQGTIQNDNLPIGRFWETWFQKPIENNANHLMANGYANSWVIDVDKLCSENPTSCRKNPPCEIGQDKSCISQGKDGTYDLELVVEFWPQRLFYIGLGISGVTLLGCLVFLGFDYVKRRKAEVAGPKDLEKV